MKYKEWAEYIDEARRQYYEGAITAEEYYNAVIGYMMLNPIEDYHPIEERKS